jgi:WD40 repeat protein
VRKLAVAWLQGEVRVWSTTNAAFPLRKALLGLPGGVEDVVWDTSGTILGLAGQGVDKARILTVDSGTDMGAMATQSKPCLAAAASSASPSSFAFGGESNNVGLYAGKPGKLVKNLTEHTAFVNAVAFSPDGTKLVTVSQTSHPTRAL